MNALVPVDPSKDIPGTTELATHGACIVDASEAYTFLDDMFFLSGEIPRVTPFEHGFPAISVSSSSRRARTLALSTCSATPVALFPKITPHAILGGFHLAGANEDIIPQTVEALKRFDLQTIAAGHCTGWRAMTALAHALTGSRLEPSVVGKRYVF